MPEKAKVVNIMGVKVSEAKLRESLKDVIAKRGIAATLILENTAELAKARPIGDDPPPYYNIYKYAFF